MDTKVFPKPRVIQRLGSCIAAGLGALMPLMVVIVVANVLQKLTNSFLGGATQKIIEVALPASWQLGPFKPENVPLLSLALLVVILLLIGSIAKTRFGQNCFNWLDHCMGRIPFAGGIYSSVRKATRVVAMQSNQKQFDRIVYIDVTGHGQLQMALVMKTTKLTLERRTELQQVERITAKKHLVVMLPSPPNPTGGAIRLVPVDQAWDPGIPFARGMQIIMTYGMETPDAMDLRNVANDENGES